MTVYGYVRVSTAEQAASGDSLATQQRQIAAHDAQIDALLKISEENARNWKNLERQWQAYINTLPRQ